MSNYVCIQFFAHFEHISYQFCINFSIHFEISQFHNILGIQQNGIELFFRTVGKHLLRLLSKYSNTIHNVSVAAIDGVHRLVLIMESNMNL